MVCLMTAGDARFVRIYEAHYAAVYAYCRRRASPERVEDAVADTFLTAWRKIDDLPSEDQVLPWLYRVAYRVLGHQWRSSSRSNRLRQKLDAIDANPVTTQPEEVIVLREESRLVVEAAERLKTSDREILRLALWEELKQADIAVALGLSTDAVKKRLSRARQNLTREFNRLEKKRNQVPAAQEGGAR